MTNPELQAAAREVAKRLYYLNYDPNSNRQDEPNRLVDESTAAIVALVEQGQREALDKFEHRIDCDTAISELYGWRGIVEMAKDETLRILGIPEPKEQPVTNKDTE